MSDKLTDYLALIDQERESRPAEAILADTIGELLEVLRRHVMDWGNCDNLPSCGCSHATALHLLQRFGGTE